MRVISRRAIREFAQVWPDALGPLNRWAQIVESSNWPTPAAIRRSMNTADLVGELVVFDIGGNKYRLIAYVHYRQQAVYIKHILAHREYDKGEWRQ